MAISPSLTSVCFIPDTWPLASSGAVPIWSQVPESLLQMLEPCSQTLRTHDGGDCCLLTGSDIYHTFPSGHLSFNCF